MNRTTATVTALLVLVTAGTAWAQNPDANPDRGIDAQAYKPALDGNGLYTVESAEMLAKGDLSFQFEINYGNTPLKLPVPGIGDSGEDSALEFALTGHFTFNFAFRDWVSLGVDVGVFRTQPDSGYGVRGRYDTNSPGGIRVPSTGLISMRPLSNIDRGVGGLDGRSGPIDPRLGLRFNLFRRQSISIAAMGHVWIPFGDEEMFLGDRSFVFEPKLAVDWRPVGPLRLGINAGARFRKRTVLEATPNGDPTSALAVFDLGSEAVLAGGLVWEVLPRVLIGAEATYLLPLPESLSYGDCELFDGADCDELEDRYITASGMTFDDRYFGDAEYGDPTGYFLGGVSFRATKDATLVASAGSGFAGERADAFRFIVAARWQPKPFDEGGIGARGDDDKDGIPNSRDACPLEPEDNDNFQDDDGCPEEDNDGDSFPDTSDACPMEPEDRDGYKDDDGCPELDNDDDGVPDVTDRCPFKKEDLDNFEDGDGCPDVDNDGDGIPDDKDQCPIQPETVNGTDDTDGCPDATARTGPIFKADENIIDLQGTRVEFRGKTANFTPAGKEVLDQVAGEILANNLVVRVEVHTARSTQSKNKNLIKRAQARDLKLSRQRAQAVVQYLLAKRVPETNVNPNLAVGLGSSRPRTGFAEYDPNQNRVDFVVTRQINK